MIERVQCPAPVLTVLQFLILLPRGYVATSNYVV
jgi:hypothetical protein